MDLRWVRRKTNKMYENCRGYVESLNMCGYFENDEILNRY